jgi:ribosome biogenesis GTPase / thiamine phosphate phosphatase
MQGRIVAHHFGPYLTIADQKSYVVHYPKTDKHLLKPIVGDVIDFDPNTNQILAIHPRKNLVIRPSLVNLDRLYVVSSLVEPTYSLLLNLKFLTFALYYELQPILILTKLDKQLMTPSMLLHMDYLIHSGIPTIQFDTKSKQGLKHIQETLLNRVVAFAGQTGVGKSSIINTISPTFHRSIGSYSQALGRGKHQTKEVVLVAYEQGWIADTPGFSSLDLPLTPIEFAIYFPGFKSRLGQCKFSNCLHDSETHCQIKEDVKHGKIPIEVYEVYLALLTKLGERKTS